MGDPFQIIRAIDVFSSWEETIWSENEQTTLETTAFEEENRWSSLRVPNFQTKPSKFFDLAGSTKRTFQIVWLRNGTFSCNFLRHIILYIYISYTFGHRIHLHNCVQKIVVRNTDKFIYLSIHPSIYICIGVVCVYIYTYKSVVYIHTFVCVHICVYI